MPISLPPHEADTLRSTLAQSGMRYTKQRDRVYVYLLGTDEHPTAQQIFDGVRDETPAISLATVYKSLEALVHCGLVAKLVLEEGPTRYDARTEDHGHSRCVRCGAVRDLSDVRVREALDPATGTETFLVTGYHLEVSGVCERCLQGLPCGTCSGATSCAVLRNTIRSQQRTHRVTKLGPDLPIASVDSPRVSQCSADRPAGESPQTTSRALTQKSRLDL